MVAGFPPDPIIVAHYPGVWPVLGLAGAIYPKLLTLIRMVRKKGGGGFPLPCVNGYLDRSVGQKDAVIDQVVFGDPLTVHIEQSVESARGDGRGDDTLNLGTVDFNGNGAFLVGRGGLLSGLSFHLLQTGNQSLGLTDGEGRHGLKMR